MSARELVGMAGLAVGSGLALAVAVDVLTGQREPFELEGWTVVPDGIGWRAYPPGDLDPAGPRCLTRSGAVRWTMARV